MSIREINKQICTACCCVFVRFGNVGSDESTEVASFICEYNWDKLFKNESWLKVLKKVENDSLLNDFLVPYMETLRKYFPDEFV